MFESWYPPNIGCLCGLVSKRDDRSKRAMWMGSVQESHMNGIGPREQCEWDQSKRAMWKGIGLWEPYEWDWSKRAMWMGSVQESNVNGIGPREQCEWGWSKRVQTTHDYPWPDTAGLRCAREFRACGAASRAFGASRRSTAWLPACLPACHYCTHSCLVPACLPACYCAAPLGPRPALSPHTLSSRARMHLRALSSLFLSLLRLLSLPLSGMRSFFFCCIQFRSLVAAFLYTSASSSSS